MVMALAQVRQQLQIAHGLLLLMLLLLQVDCYHLHGPCLCVRCWHHVARCPCWSRLSLLRSVMLMWMRWQTARAPRSLAAQFAGVQVTHGLGVFRFQNLQFRLQVFHLATQLDEVFHHRLVRTLGPNRRHGSKQGQHQ